MRFYIVFLFYFSCGAYLLQAQPGCTDPQASNYNPDATANDGSCYYPVTNYSLSTKTLLASNLGETSGLIFANGAVWTHGDSGNPPVLFKMDTLTNTVLQTVSIGGASNMDWEDIAFDGTYFYLGDFGNNVDGNRTDLKIYKFPFSAIPSGAEVAVPETAVEVIHFSYEDQVDFTPQGSNHTRFDCEAMICFEGQLHLFTKDWLEFNTVHYTLPTTAGTHQAIKQEVFYANGLITGADVTASGVIALLGYRLNSGELFMWLLFDYPGTACFGGNKRRIELGSLLSFGQVEGICFRNDAYGYISNEKVLGIIPSRLYSFDIRLYLPATFLKAGEIILKKDTLCHTLPNPASSYPFSEWVGRLPLNTLMNLWDAGGRQIWTGTAQNFPAMPLAPGTYGVQLYTREQNATLCTEMLLIK